MTINPKHLDFEIEEWDVWNKTRHHWTFNKLDTSLKLGYKAAPVSVPVPESGKYCIRPIYNLQGMGIYARICELEKGQTIQDHPSMFWCEYFEGPHYSIDYIWHSDMMVGGWWEPVFATQGFNCDNNLIEFTHWNKINPPKIELPRFLKDLQDCEVLNIEFIGNKIIEIHQRLGNLAGDWYNLDRAETIVPIWENTPKSKCQRLENDGYKYVARDCATYGNYTNKRLGFYYK
jgi:hypothetical protein